MLSPQVTRERQTRNGAKKVVRCCFVTDDVPDISGLILENDKGDYLTYHVDIPCELSMSGSECSSQDDSIFAEVFCNDRAPSDRAPSEKAPSPSLVQRTASSPTRCTSPLQSQPEKKQPKQRVMNMSKSSASRRVVKLATAVPAKKRVTTLK